MKVEVVEVYYTFDGSFATFVVELSKESVSFKMEILVPVQSYHKYLAARNLVEKHAREAGDDLCIEMPLGMLTYPVAHREMKSCCEEEGKCE